MEGVFECMVCGVQFKQKHNRDRHVVLLHGGAERVYDCVICGAIFRNVLQLHQHIGGHRPDTEFTLLQNAFRSSATVYRKVYVPSLPSLEDTILADADNVVRVMVFEVAAKRSVKCALVVTVEFVKLDETAEIVGQLVHHVRTPSFALTPYQDQQEIFHMQFQRVHDNIDDFLQSGSGKKMFFHL